MCSIWFLLGVLVILFLGIKDSFFFYFFGGIIFLAGTILSLVAFYEEKRYNDEMQPELGLLNQKDKQERERIQKEYDSALEKIKESDPLERVHKINSIKQKYESDLETWQFKYKKMLEEIKKVKGVKDFHL